MNLYLYKGESNSQTYSLTLVHLFVMCVQSYLNCSTTIHRRYVVISIVYKQGAFH